MLPRIDLELARKSIVEGLKNYVFQVAGKKGGVIGVSGGVDSAVAALLAAEALGSENLHPVILPSLATPKEDVEDAFLVAEKAGVTREKVEVIEIEPILRCFDKALGPMTHMERGNLAARVRMSILHQRAYKYNSIVIGTGDKSELLIGYFTKYGDGGVDVLPIGGLYKTYVRQMALHLGLPERIAFKPSSPRLWPDHEAEKEIGLSYEIIDEILFGLFDKRLKPEEVSKQTGISMEIIQRVINMHLKTDHKRRPPPVIEPVIRYL
ncbi:MAG: NAD+ synthase [Infirmifilum sp.]|uniref:NH(3)-dependent NAD(+) synthetase n=1 Tax=Infirmifilum uzonense TaxID=1550241 RepID=A0A0F7FIT9_9CREN|nr:NAD synthetase [Infirmifilum uzonense]